MRSPLKLTSQRFVLSRKYGDTTAKLLLVLIECSKDTLKPIVLDFQRLILLFKSRKLTGCRLQPRLERVHCAAGITDACDTLLKENVFISQRLNFSRQCRVPLQQRLVLLTQRLILLTKLIKFGHRVAFISTICQLFFKHHVFLRKHTGLLFHGRVLLGHGFNQISDSGQFFFRGDQFYLLSGSFFGSHHDRFVLLLPSQTCLLKAFSQSSILIRQRFNFLAQGVGTLDISRLISGERLPLNDLLGNNHTRLDNRALDNPALNRLALDELTSNRFPINNSALDWLTWNDQSLDRLTLDDLTLDDLTLDDLALDDLASLNRKRCLLSVQGSSERQTKTNAAQCQMKLFEVNHLESQMMGEENHERRSRLVGRQLLDCQTSHAARVASGSAVQR